MPRVNSSACVALALAAACCLAAQEIPRLQGKALGIDGGAVKLFDTQNRARTTLVVRDSVVGLPQGHPDNLLQPRFSPDGTRICFLFTWWFPDSSGKAAAMYVADNDGANITRVCDMDYSHAGVDYQPLSWCTDGYIYWSRCTDTILRVSPLLKQPEAYWSGVGVAGYKTDGVSHGPYVEALTVCRDGSVGASNCYEKVWALDLAGRQSLGSHGGGCRGAISTNGRSVIHWLTCCGYYPPGYDPTNAFLSVTLLENVPNRDDFTYLFAPGCAAAPTPGNRVWMMRGACNDTNYVVGVGDANLRRYGVLLHKGTSDYMLIPGPDSSTAFTPTDFWLGVLPLPPAAGPRIGLDSTWLNFVAPGASAPPAKAVMVVNTGIGQLGDVSVVEDASWLTVARSGSGNSQSLANTADPAGLARGAYTTTVSVVGGGAANAQNYAVTLNVGSTVAAPTALEAAVSGTWSISLRWRDNADNEQGCLLERRGETGAWVQAAALPANSSAHVDSGLRTGLYAYRIRAFAGADTSGWSNEASGAISAVISIAVSAPGAGERLAACSSYVVRWAATNSSGVSLEYSLSDGSDWVALPTPGGSIRPGDSSWQSFRWTVPDTEAPACRLQVFEYMDRAVSGVSEQFAITRQPFAVQPLRPVRPQAGVAPFSVFDFQGRLVCGAGGSPGWVRLRQGLGSGVYLVRTSSPGSGALSRLGQGATFTAWLPAMPPADAGP